MSTEYQDRRKQSHDCTRFVVPLQIIRDEQATIPSALEQLPHEVLLYIKDFLKFRDRSCMALTNKFMASIMLERTPGDPFTLHIKNKERKQFLVHPAQVTTLDRSGHPHIQRQQLSQISTHTCGQYKCLLHALSKDWNTWGRKLCPTCCAFRPTCKEFWALRAEEVEKESKSADGEKQSGSVYERERYLQSAEEWVQGKSCRCPDCEPTSTYGPDIDFPVLTAG